MDGTGNSVSTPLADLDFLFVVRARSPWPTSRPTTSRDRGGLCDMTADGAGDKGGDREDPIDGDCERVEESGESGPSLSSILNVLNAFKAGCF